MAGFISEFRYIGGTSVEFIEIAVPAGTDVSGYSVVIYNSDGTVAHTYSLTTVQSTSGGNDVYVLDSGTAGYADILNGQAIALIDDTGTVDQFVSFGGSTVTATSGPAAGETSTNVGSVGFGQSLQSDDGGASYYTQTAPNKGSVPCYTPGTMIDTPHGPRAVETLCPGDLVLGPVVVSAVTTRERQTLARIFGTAVLPEMALNGPPSRECLAVGTVRRHLMRRSKVQTERYPKEKTAIGALAQRSWAPSRVSAS